MKRALLVAALVGALASPALAHRGHAGLTVVEIDPASGAVSVVHRFAAHDVEPALVSIAPEAQPSLDDPRAVADLEKRFSSWPAVSGFGSVRWKAWLSRPSI